MPSDPDFPFAPADPSQWWQTRALPHILVQPNAPANAGSTNPAGSDGIDDWFVPTPGLSQDGFPDDWFVPGNAEAVASQPGGGVNPNNSNAPALATAPSPTPSAPNPQPSGAPPTTPGPSNQPAPPRPDPLAAYWSLIPASRAGAFAWHPPIFLNSAGQFPPPASTYDPPILPAYGLFGSIAKMPATSAAANARPIGGGGGLFDSLAGLSAANTDTPPSIFGAIARPPYAASMPGSNPSSSPSYPPYLGGSALPSYLADPPPPPDPTLFAWLPQLPGPTAAGDSPLGPWNGAPIASSQGAATAASPTRSVLFNHAPAAWDPGAPDRNAANLDQTARTLGVSGLSLSKSGAPFVSPPPQLLITPAAMARCCTLGEPESR